MKTKCKLFTLKNVSLLLLVLFSWVGLILLWINPEVGRALTESSFIFLIWFVYFEVKDLKNWGENNINQLVKAAEVSAAAAYKLKQYGGKVSVNGKEL